MAHSSQASTRPIPPTADDEIDPNRNPPEPSPECLFGLVGDIAHAASAHSEAHPHAVAAACLSYLSVAVGCAAFFEVGDDRHHCRLFGLHIGRSGRGRKGTATKLVKRIHAQLSQTHPSLAPLIHDGGLSSREGLALLVADPDLSSPDADTDQGTAPPLTDKRLWILEPEFANVLGQSSRQGNTLSSALRECWDGGSIKPATKNARVWSTEPHIALTGNITPKELLTLLNTRELTNGFANRFLMYWAEQPRLVALPQPTDPRTVAHLTQRVAEVLRFAQADQPRQRNTLRMTMTPEAKDCYSHLYLTELRSTHLGETVTALMERGAPMLLRIAMLLALTEHTRVIGRAHIEAAMHWVRYGAASVGYVFQTDQEEVETQQVSAVVEKIQQFLRQESRPVTRTMISRTCLAGRVSKEITDRALEVLLTANPPRVRIQQLPSPARGGPKTKLYQLAS